jgi:pilus assembly protein Flp/PilA
MLNRFLQDEDGATAIEYGLIAALIGVAIITAAGLVGDGLNSTFNQVADKLGSDGGATTP